MCVCLCICSDLQIKECSDVSITMIVFTSLPLYALLVFKNAGVRQKTGFGQDVFKRADHRQIRREVRWEALRRREPLRKSNQQEKVGAWHDFQCHFSRSLLCMFCGGPLVV